MAYNGLNERNKMLDGIGVANEVQTKINFCKKILDKSHNLQSMAIRSLKDYLYFYRQKQQKNKYNRESLCKRMLESSKRNIIQAFGLLKNLIRSD